VGNTPCLYIFFGDRAIQLCAKCTAETSKMCAHIFPWLLILTDLCVAHFKCAYELKNSTHLRAILVKSGGDVVMFLGRDLELTGAQEGLMTNAAHNQPAWRFIHP
jgi:hypothetical protein